MKARGWAIAVVASAGLLAAACGGGDDGSSAPAPASGGGGGGTATVGVKDFAFDPSTVTVTAGETTITVTNSGAATHSFTLDDGSASVDIEPGATETVVVNITADATFHCTFHSQMTGTLKVG